MAHGVKDMTKGAPGKLLLSFALPLMLSNICQQLYTIVDTAVVGRFVGVEALAALGASDWIGWMVLGILTGFGQGCSILIAQRFGAKDGDGLKKALAMSVALTAGVALVTLALSQTAMEWLLRALDTPEAVQPLATTYLRIYFAGIPVVMAYNLCAGTLRALGNASAPMKAVLLSSAVNIALDLLFTLAFHWGVAGVAAATVIAQCVSLVYCLLVMRRIPESRLSRADAVPDAKLLRRLTKLSLPVAAQNVIISIGGLVVQAVVNRRGVDFVAGFTATNKMYGLLELAAISYGYAIASYCGQNLGAKAFLRIRDGIRVSLALCLATSLVIGAAMIGCGRMILSLFVTGAPEDVARVLDVAYRYLFVMSAPLPILYLLYVYRSALQGMGNTLMPMLSGFLELVMRVGAVLTLPALAGDTGIFLAEPLAWTGAVLILVPAYYAMYRRLRTTPRPGL